MYCSNCGAEIANNSLFCKYCGAKVNINDNNDIVLVQNQNNEYVAKSIKKNKKSSWRPFGFRSGKWYKAAVACIYFFFLFIMYFGTILEFSESESPIGDIIMLVAFTLPYLIMSNLFGLQEKLPLYNSKNPILKITACAITFFTIVYIATLFMPDTVETTESDIAKPEELEQMLEEDPAQEEEEQQEQQEQTNQGAKPPTQPVKPEPETDQTEQLETEEHIDDIGDLHLATN